MRVQFFLLLLGISASGAVCAADESTALSAGIALSASRVDYREFDGAGQQLDRETATLPGMTLSLGGPLADFSGTQRSHCKKAPRAMKAERI